MKFYEPKTKSGKPLLGVTIRPGTKDRSLRGKVA
jgi:hypothetical protein